MRGPGGKYDSECVANLKTTQADAVVLIVMGGSKGSGFSVAAKDECKKTLAEQLPRILEDVAKQIREDIAREDYEKEITE